MLIYRMETGPSAQQVHTYHRCYPTFTPTLYTLGAIYRGHLINVQTQAYWGCGGNWGNPQGECAYSAQTTPEVRIKGRSLAL